ncbi:MAG: histidine phosphatase family protein [Sulfuricurvum sp.]
MRHLYLIRHAKSDWSDPGLSDFDRPLNARGEKNAPFMGSVLHARAIRPDLILASPAVRAKSTAVSIAEAIGYPPEEIRYDESLYLADPLALETALRRIDDSVRSVFLVAHNPGLTEYVTYLSGYPIDNVPTCGIVEIALPARWSDLTQNSGNFVSFDYPKRHKKS